MSEDDIIDLETLEIVVNNGVLEGTRTGRYAIGTFGIAGTRRESDDEGDEDVPWEERDTADEADAIGGWTDMEALPAAAYQEWLEKTEEQSRDLRSFLESEAKAKGEKIGKGFDSEEARREASRKEGTMFHRWQEQKKEIKNALLPLELVEEGEQGIESEDELAIQPVAPSSRLRGKMVNLHLEDSDDERMIASSSFSPIVPSTRRSQLQVNFLCDWSRFLMSDQFSSQATSRVLPSSSPLQRKELQTKYSSPPISRRSSRKFAFEIVVDQFPSSSHPPTPVKAPRSSPPKATGSKSSASSRKPTKPTSVVSRTQTRRLSDRGDVFGTQPDANVVEILDDSQRGLRTPPDSRDQSGDQGKSARVRWKGKAKVSNQEEDVEAEADDEGDELDLLAATKKAVTFALGSIPAKYTDSPAWSRTRSQANSARKRSTGRARSLSLPLPPPAFTPSYIPSSGSPQMQATARQSPRQAKLSKTGQIAASPAKLSPKALSARSSQPSLRSQASKAINSPQPRINPATPINSRASVSSRKISSSMQTPTLRRYRGAPSTGTNSDSEDDFLLFTPDKWIPFEGGHSSSSKRDKQLWERSRRLKKEEEMGISEDELLIKDEEEIS